MGRMAEVAHIVETFSGQRDYPRDETLKSQSPPASDAPSELAQIIERKAASAWLEIAELEELQRKHPELFANSTAVDVLSMSFKLDAMRGRMEHRHVA